jgi:hypothetical protein
VKINDEIVDIFWDNGKYVAVAKDKYGVRRNYAPYNCQSKIAAEIALRNSFAIQLTKRQKDYEREN